jgi:hypothetical protein
MESRVEVPEWSRAQTRWTARKLAFILFRAFALGFIIFGLAWFNGMLSLRGCLVMIADRMDIEDFTSYIDTTPSEAASADNTCSQVPENEDILAICSSLLKDRNWTLVKNISQEPIEEANLNTQEPIEEANPNTLLGLFVNFSGVLALVVFLYWLWPPNPSTTTGSALPPPVMSPSNPSTTRSVLSRPTTMQRQGTSDVDAVKKWLFAFAGSKKYKVEFRGQDRKSCNDFKQYANEEDLTYQEEQRSDSSHHEERAIGLAPVQTTKKRFDVTIGRPLVLEQKIETPLVTLVTLLGVYLTATTAPTLIGLLGRFVAVPVGTLGISGVVGAMIGGIVGFLLGKKLCLSAGAFYSLVAVVGGVAVYLSLYLLFYNPGLRIYFWTGLGLFKDKLPSWNTIKVLWGDLFNKWIPLFDTWLFYARHDFPRFWVMVDDYCFTEYDDKVDIICCHLECDGHTPREGSPIMQYKYVQSLSMKQDLPSLRDAIFRSRWMLPTDGRAKESPQDEKVGQLLVRLPRDSGDREAILQTFLNALHAPDRGAKISFACEGQSAVRSEPMNFSIIVPSEDGKCRVLVVKEESIIALAKTRKSRPAMWDGRPDQRPDADAGDENGSISTLTYDIWCAMLQMSRFHSAAWQESPDVFTYKATKAIQTAEQHHVHNER